jgi:hypothetical protein
LVCVSKRPGEARLHEPRRALARFGAAGRPAARLPISHLYGWAEENLGDDRHDQQQDQGPGHQRKAHGGSVVAVEERKVIDAHNVLAAVLGRLDKSAPEG